MRRPVDGNPSLSSYHGQPTLLGFFGKHLGCDYVVKNVSVKSPVGGKVLASSFNVDIGNYIELAGDDGRTHRVMHLSHRDLVAGQRVEEGQQLGISGNTGKVVGANGGYHLHWDVRVGGSAWNSSFANYFNPEALLSIQNQPQSVPASNPAGSFSVGRPVPGYITSADAALRHGSNSIVPVGTYAVFNRANGMVNVTPKPGRPGWWINPADVASGPVSAPAPQPAPQQRTYTVSARDADGLIAAMARIGVSDWKAVAAHNGLAAPYIIRPGQVLIIP